MVVRRQRTQWLWEHKSKANTQVSAAAFQRRRRSSEICNWALSSTQQAEAFAAREREQWAGRGGRARRSPPTAQLLWVAVGRRLVAAPRVQPRAAFDFLLGAHLSLSAKIISALSRNKNRVTRLTPRTGEHIKGPAFVARAHRHRRVPPYWSLLFPSLSRCGAAAYVSSFADAGVDGWWKDACVPSSPHTNRGSWGGWTGAPLYQNALAAEQSRAPRPTTAGIYG